MFYNAKPHIFEKAKMLRANMTPAEIKIWEKLKGKQVLGLRFRAQHPIDIFIADFYCHSVKLVIEIDGGIHFRKNQHEYDIGREAEISQFGILVIRFTNEEVETNLDQLVEQIKIVCRDRLRKGQSPL